MKKLISMLILLLSTINMSAVTLYTPNGKSFTTSDGGWSSYDADWFEEYKDGFGPGTLYPNSEVLGEWESGIWEYNCHVFAWNNWQGADRWSSESDMWKLGKPSPYNLMWRPYPDVWYTDSDNPIGIVSYISASSSEAAICTYSGNHSARIVGDGSYFISKWGRNPIIKHPPTEVPTSYYSVDAYFKINPAYRPIGDGDPAGRDWETINNAISGITSGSLISVLSGTQTLTGNISVPSGVTLEIMSGVTVNLGSYSIISSGGTITIESGATINSSNSHVRLVTGSTINRLCPTIASAAAAVSSGQTIEIYGPHTLTTNYSIPSVISLSIKSGATLTLGSYSIVSSGGTITVASGVTISPDVRRKSGSTILGLYPSISSALSAASSGQTVEYGGSHTMSGNLTVASGKILTAKAGSTLSFGSGYYLSVSGTLNASGTSASRATFTRSGTSGTWGGIKYSSGSSGSLSACNISNATYGVRLYSSGPVVDGCTISNCGYGIYCSGASPAISNNNISGSSNCGLYVYNGSPNVKSNEVGDCNVYLNASDAYLEDNYFSEGSGSYACHLYASSPHLTHNTISSSEALVTLYANTGSDPVFDTGYGYGLGYNIITGHINADGVIWAYNSSHPDLCGPNSIGRHGTTVLQAAAIDGGSSIDAVFCWWGTTSQPIVSGKVETSYQFQYDPGGGSSLAKAPLADRGGVENSDNPGGFSAVENLWSAAMSFFDAQQFQHAIPVFKRLIIAFPNSVYAHKAISRLMQIGRLDGKFDLIVILDELINRVDDSSLRAALQSRKTLLFRQRGEFTAAIAMAAEIAAEHADSYHECSAWFDLFNLYHKDLGDSGLAAIWLGQLKTKYPETDLTAIAQTDFGETPPNVKLTRPALPPVAPGEVETIATYQLKPNFPNPFNPVTSIAYDLPEDSQVRIAVFNLAGQLIEQLTDDAQCRGHYRISWDASAYPSGVYFFRMEACQLSNGEKKYSRTQKGLLIK